MFFETETAKLSNDNYRFLQRAWRKSIQVKMFVENQFWDESKTIEVFHIGVL